MTKPELLSLYRVLADDATEPYLLSSAKANLFIAEAEREGAERALYLRTGADYNIKVVAGKADYSLSGDIIFIDRAKLSGGRLPLRQATRADLDYRFYDWESQIGVPTFFIVENLTLTLFPVPNADFSLSLDGSRRPVEDMETPEHLHESLVYWVLYCHYSRADADLVDASAASKNLKLFEAAFGHKRSASFDAAWKNGAKKSHESSPF